MKIFWYSSKRSKILKQYPVQFPIRWQFYDILIYDEYCFAVIPQILDLT